MKSFVYRFKKLTPKRSLIFYFTQSSETAEELSKSNGTLTCRSQTNFVRSGK